jgi:F1F0 ATPase subunit 2
MKMVMNEILTLAFALAEGALLGLFFFAGLWWTVRKLGSTKSVALWFLGSLLLRTSLVVAGFYFILGDDWQRLLAGLLGFVIARLIVTRLIRLTESPRQLARRAGHAP